MIPRLNRCPVCNQRGPDLPWAEASRAMHRALHDLAFIVAEGWRIDRLSLWLSKRLPA